MKDEIQKFIKDRRRFVLDERGKNPRQLTNEFIAGYSYALDELERVANKKA